MKEYNFEGIIKASEVGKGGAYVELPTHLEKELEIKGRIKIHCFFENTEYRGSLVKMGTPCYIIGITKSIRNSLNKTIGDKINIRFFKDENKRIIETHPLLISAFTQNNNLLKKYERLSYTAKKEINTHLTSAKKEETLKKRIEKIIIDLMKIK